jgi:hypothetical protein
VLFENLTPGATFEVTVWGYDDGSGGADRVSDWFANGDLAYDDYVFNRDDIGAGGSPLSDDIYQFSFLASSDGLGSLLISGRSGGVNPSVFLNAIELSQVSIVPEPATFALLGLGGLALLRRRRRA